MHIHLESALRLARVSRRSPWLKGLGIVRTVYGAVLPFPEGWTMRVDDFDQTLMMDVDPRDIIGINIWHRPELFEKKERELFCSAIFPGAIVLDIGANIGIYTLLAAKRGARVFAIEADPDNAKTLRHHVELNGYNDRVTVLEMAATEAEQTMTLYRDPTNSGHSNLYSGVVPVRVYGKSVDSLKLPAVDVCKIDVEGSEAGALRGMVRTISNSPRLRMLIEHSAQFGHTSEMMSFLRQHFTDISVAGRGALGSESTPPRFCNLWVSGARVETGCGSSDYPQNEGSNVVLHVCQGANDD